MDYGKLLTLKANKKGEEALRAISAGLVAIGNALGLSQFIDAALTVKGLMRLTKAEDKLGMQRLERLENRFKEILGKSMVAWEGMEKVNLEISEILETCVVDDLVLARRRRRLVPVVAKPQ